MNANFALILFNGVCVKYNKYCDCVFCELKSLKIRGSNMKMKFDNDYIKV